MHELQFTNEELDHLFLALMTHSGEIEEQDRTFPRTEENVNYTQRQREINITLTKYIDSQR